MFKDTVLIDSSDEQDLSTTMEMKVHPDPLDNGTSSFYLFPSYSMQASSLEAKQEWIRKMRDIVTERQVHLRAGKIPLFASLHSDQFLKYKSILHAASGTFRTLRKKI